VAAIVASACDGTPAAETFVAVAGVIRRAAGLSPDVGPVSAGLDRPRLSESWFCCAEPTVAQTQFAR
jgi:hypothetical protein